MIISTRRKESASLLRFAERAAKAFGANKELATFSDVTIDTPGCFLALRWGMDDNSVLVVKIDSEFTPTNFRGLISEIKVEMEEEVLRG